MVLVQMISLEFSSQTCQRTEQTSTKEIEGIKYVHGYRKYRRYNETVVESEEYNCENISLPMGLFSYHCENCTSKLIIKSLVQSTVPPLSFSQAYFFSVIRMENVGITDILPAAFNSLTKLKELYISNNRISIFLDGLLSSLSNLEILDISSNQLRNITKHSFIGLTNLKLLNLSHNHLANFEARLVYNDESIQIDLSFNILTHFNFENISEKIQKLNLSHNAITNINGCFSSIEILEVDHNKLNAIANENCNVSSNILLLNLGYNTISELSTKTFSGLRSLQKLYLDNNNLSSLQTDIFSNLLNLQLLILSGNRFTDFDHGVFEHLPRLEILDLSKNNLTDVKRYFHTLTNLLRLDLKYNHLSDLDSSQLVLDLPALQFLTLNGNNLSCEKLIEIYHNLQSKNVVLQVGSTKTSNNIQGIACEPSTKEVSAVSSGDKNYELSKFKYLLEKYQTSETSMFNFFNGGFKDSNFYKYLESLNQVHLLSFNQTELIKYFDKDFRNTTFFRLFNNSNNSFCPENKISKGLDIVLKKSLIKSQEIDDFLNNTFNKSIFYNFFNNDFSKSQFYHYCHTMLHNFPSNVTPVELKTSEAKKLEDKKCDSTDYDYYYGILLTLVFLQVILIFLVGVSTYVTVKQYSELIKTNFKYREQLELIRS